MMHPAIYEGLVLAALGAGGVSLAILFGARGVVNVASLGFGLAVVNRVLSAFLMWSLGMHGLAWEFWMVTSLVPILALAVLRRHNWKDWLLGSAVLGFLSLIALSTKYVFDIGERHHADSAKILAIALIPIQRELSDISPLAGQFKRGMAYPLMLALGPDGRILSALTPMVFMVSLMFAVWIAWNTLPKNRSWAPFVVALAAISFYSVTVPIFRASMFYLNGHTLMGFGLLLIVASLLRLREFGRFDSVAFALAFAGSVIGATARIEGVLLVIIGLAAIVSAGRFNNPSERFLLFTAVASGGLSLTWWLHVVGSVVLDRFSVNNLAVALLSVVGATVVSLLRFDKLRRLIFPLVGLVMTSLIIMAIARSSDPVDMVLAQWPNLGLGAGGWGTAALVFAGSVMLLGFRQRADNYQVVLLIVILWIEGILFSKTFDGGFGGAGFYDSVNRMWLHLLPTVVTLTLIGYTDFLSDLLPKKKLSFKQQAES